MIQEVDGETIVYSTGGSELRVDKPIPPKKPKKNAPKKKEPPKVAKKPEPKKKAPPKPLTRLEKLRLEQKKRLEEDAEAGSGKQKS